MGIFMHSHRSFISVEWSSSDPPVHAPVSQSYHHDGINRGGGENLCQETYWLSRKEGRLDHIRISHFVSPSILSHSAVDAGTPGGTEPVGVWMDGRGRLPDMPSPSLIPPQIKQRTASTTTTCLFQVYPLPCSTPKHRHS